MRRAVDLDPGPTRPTPAKGVPARQPDPEPAYRPPPTRPTRGPSHTDLVIDLRLRSDDVPALVGALPSAQIAAGEVGLGPSLSEHATAPSAGGSAECSRPDADTAPATSGRAPVINQGVGAQGSWPTPGEVAVATSTDGPPDLRQRPGAAGRPGIGSAEPFTGLRAAWPEIRFYVGSFGLFFVTYSLITALLVGLAVVLLGLHPVAITSGSMEPLVQVGDVVLFTNPPPADRESPDGRFLLPGTVIGFDERGTGRAITHRIVSIDRDGAYVTRGDANPSPDPQVVSPEQIWGVGRLLVPYGGYPAAWLAVGAVWKVALLSIFLLGCAYSTRWALLDEFNPWLHT